MAIRPYGTAVVSFNFEPQAASPIDARLVVPKLADLTNVNTFRSIDNVNYAYPGMLVAIAEDGNNNGVYRLNALPTTDPENWKMMGEGEAPTSLPVQTIHKTISLDSDLWDINADRDAYEYDYEDEDILSSQYTVVYISNESRQTTTLYNFKNVASIEDGHIIFTAKIKPSADIELTIIGVETTSTFTKVECFNTTNFITASSQDVLTNKSISTENGNTISGLNVFSFDDDTIVTEISTGRVSNTSIPTTEAVREYVDDAVESVSIDVSDLRQEVEQKQDTLTFDSIPTEGSNNPVTSSGLKGALDNKADRTELQKMLTSDNVIAGDNITIDILDEGGISISSTGGLTEVDATQVTYSNPDYPTVAAALDKLLYVALTASMSGGGTYELGTSLSSVNLSWSYNKASIVSQSINQGIGDLADLTKRSYTVTGPFTSNKTWTLTASDGTTTKTASTSISFQPKRYWGVSASTSLTNEEILGLSSELSTSRGQTRTFNCSGGRYFYFAIRTDYCSNIKFTVGGLSYTGYTVTTQTVTNALGYSASYNVYRSGNIQTGSTIPVVVS